MDYVNSTTHFNMTLFVPNLDRTFGVVIGSSYLACLGLLLLVQRGIFKLLKRKADRPVNRLIRVQQSAMALIYPVLCLYLACDCFIFPMKNVISVNGCYFLDLLQGYVALYNQCVSFFVSLFRYICIMHSNILKRSWIGIKGLVNVVITAQYLIPAVVLLAIRFPSGPTTGNARDLYTCKGDYFLYFDQNLDDDIDPFKYQVCEANASGPYWLFCILTYSFFRLFLASNIVEVYLLYKCWKQTKTNTQNVKDLLSPSAFQERQREDGVILAVSVWQWILEVATLIVTFPLLIMLGHSLLAKKVLLLYLMVMGIITNGFYLLGDINFNREVRTIGVVRALVRALFQSYN